MKETRKHLNAAKRHTSRLHPNPSPRTIQDWMKYGMSARRLSNETAVGHARVRLDILREERAKRKKGKEE